LYYFYFVKQELATRMLAVIRCAGMCFHVCLPLFISVHKNRFTLVTWLLNAHCYLFPEIGYSHERLNYCTT